MDETPEAQNVGAEEGPPYFIYFLKLTTGEAIIAQSFDTYDKMNEEGEVEIVGAMIIRKNYIQDRSGQVSEVQMLSPWLEGADLGMPCNVPLETVVAIMPLKESLVDKYQKALVSTVIKDLIHEQEERDAALQRAVAAVKKAKEVADLPEIDPDALASMLKHADAENKADRVTPESLHLDQMTGALEDVESELEQEEAAVTPPKPPPAYVRDGKTYH